VSEKTVTHTQVDRGRGLGASYMRAHSVTDKNQILHGDQTRGEEIFLHGRPQMMTRDLFAVANRLRITIKPCTNATMPVTENQLSKHSITLLTVGLPVIYLWFVHTPDKQWPPARIIYTGLPKCRKLSGRTGTGCVYGLPGGFPPESGGERPGSPYTQPVPVREWVFQDNNSAHWLEVISSSS